MMNNMFELVGKKISIKLEEKKLTQQYLAEKLGISKQVLSKIINGKKAINIKEITEISNALDEPIEYFIKNDEAILAKVTPQFSFMGCINKPKTKETFEMLKEVINEIQFLEEYLNDAKTAP